MCVSGVLVVCPDTHVPGARRRGCPSLCAALQAHFPPWWTRTYRCSRCTRLAQAPTVHHRPQHRPHHQHQHQHQRTSVRAYKRPAPAPAYQHQHQHQHQHQRASTSVPAPAPAYQHQHQRTSTSTSISVRAPPPRDKRTRAVVVGVCRGSACSIARCNPIQSSAIVLPPTGGPPALRAAASWARKSLQLEFESERPGPPPTRAVIPAHAAGAPPRPFASTAAVQKARRCVVLTPDRARL